MGMMERFLDFFFGAGGSVKETVEIFRENAEASAERHHQLTQGAREQFGKEFQHSGPSLFDRVMDGLNRLPRPALAFGTLGLFVAAMVDPIWFAERMGGMALVPEPLWWLLGAIVSFYFGARHQLKSQQFQKSLGQTYLRAESFRKKRRAEQAAEGVSRVAGEGEPNSALADWRQQK
ncbi:holin family protein [Tropicimonas sp. S265A]|uniref:holin family protein n=1 Tax=Tropicimonas sp. S265A TaxID=3415134 RepID=UPI003C7C422D